MITVDSKFNLGGKAYGTIRLLCDTQADVPNLDNYKNYATGSEALVISTSERYMLNSSKKWILQKNSGGSGGDSPSPDNTYIYDGGEVT